MAIGTGLLSIGFNARIRAIRDCSDIKAKCAADAALAKAIATLNEQFDDGSLNDYSLPQETSTAVDNCGSTFSYTVGKDSDGQYCVKCIGCCGPVQKNLQATLKRGGGSEYALAVRQELNLWPGTRIEGFDSEDPTDQFVKVKIGTTSTINYDVGLASGCFVDGDIFVGVGADPEVVITGYSPEKVSGEIYALEEDIEFPPVEVPDLPYIGTNLTATDKTVTIGPYDSGTYEDIVLSNGGKLMITGGDVVLHIDDDITLGNGCEIIVAAGSSLELYIDDDMTARNAAGFVNQTGSAENLMIYGSGEPTKSGQPDQTWDLKSKSTTFGVVYAPLCRCELYPNAIMEGAIASYRLEMKSGCVFKYDVSMTGTGLSGGSSTFQVNRWSE